MSTFEEKITEMMGRTSNMIAGFNGGYGRVGTIMVKHTKCDVCLEQKTTLCIDGSGQEYSYGAICRDCAINAFSKFGG